MGKNDLINLEKEYDNEKEIKRCKIKINNKLIPFHYFHKFNEIGEYKIKYIFNEEINKINFMFAECTSIINILNDTERCLH